MTRRIKTILINGEKETMKVPKISASERTWFRFRVRKDFLTGADKLRLKKKGDAWDKANEKRTNHG